MSNPGFTIVHFHFHRRKTGVTKSIEQLLPFLEASTPSFVFGYGIGAPKIGLSNLLKQLFSKTQTVIHVHRNKEMIVALLLRALGGKFALLSTRHSATKPSGLTRFLMNRADRKIFLTQDAAFDDSPKNCFIPHGINTAYFSSDSLTLAEKKQIGVVGRVRKSKGQKVVFNALYSFLKNHPEWRLTFIGKIDQKEYAREIQALAQKHGIDQQLNFLAQTEKINLFYNRCVLVIVASFSEGFSLVPLEAIASGCTVIATENVGVHSNLIKEGVNGYLFPAGDEKKLARTVADVLENKRFFSSTVLEKSIDSWKIEKIAAQTITAYKSCFSIVSL